MAGHKAGEVFIPIVPEMKGFAGEVKKEVGHAKGSVLGSLQGLGKAAGLALGAGLIAASTKAVNIELKHRVVVDELSRSIRNMAKNVRPTTLAVEKQAQALEELTGRGHDEILSADTVLARFVSTGKQLRELTPLVLDYAQSQGIDASAAADKFGKATLGSAKVLKSLGISFAASKTHQKAYTDAMKEAKQPIDAVALAHAKLLDRQHDIPIIADLIKKKVGGMAEEFGKTDAGKIAIFGQKIHDLGEQFGAWLIPKLASAVDWVNKNRETVAKLAFVLGGVLAAAIATWIGGMIAAGIATTAATGGLNLLIPAIVIGAGLIIANWNLVKGATYDMLGAMVSGFRDFLAFFLGIAQGILHAADSAFSWIPGIGDGLHDARKDFDRWVNATLEGLDRTAAGWHDLADNVRADLSSIVSAYGQAGSALLGPPAPGTPAYNQPGFGNKAGPPLPPGWGGGSGSNKKNSAWGGPLAAYEPSRVGEQGWETFVPDVPGTIIPHKESVAALAGGGKLAEHITFNHENADPGRVLADLKYLDMQRGF